MPPVPADPDPGTVLSARFDGLIMPPVRSEAISSAVSWEPASSSSVSSAANSSGIISSKSEAPGWRVRSSPERPN